MLKKYIRLIFFLYIDTDNKMIVFLEESDKLFSDKASTSGDKNSHKNIIFF